MALSSFSLSVQGCFVTIAKINTNLTLRSRLVILGGMITPFEIELMRLGVRRVGFGYALLLFAGQAGLQFI